MTALRLRTVLVATDLGDGSSRVLEEAGRVAGAAGADLHVLHVTEIPDRVPETFGSEVWTSPDVESEAAREALDDRIERVLDRTEVASREVRSGTAHEVIRARAEEISADLIVLGPNRDPDVQARFLGTTAERVLRGSDAPCLVVRSPLRLPPRRLGAPTDLSTAGSAAVVLALEWADRLAEEGTERPEVHVMHAGWTVYREDEESVRELIVEPMEEQVADALEATGAGDRVSVRSGIVWDNRSADAIVAWAEREELGLLVLGSEGRGGVKRALLGSVTTSVARRAPCSILVAPTPDEESESG